MGRAAFVSTLVPAALAAVAGFASCVCQRSSRWIEHPRAWSVTPERDGVVFIEGRDAVLRRSGGDVRLGLGVCLPGDNSGMGLVALGGQSAVVFSYGVHGGNFFESGTVEGETACRIDFRDLSVRSCPAGFLDDPRHFAGIAGGRTGWVYATGAQSGVWVWDLDADRSALLPGGGGPLREQTAGDMAFVPDDARWYVAELVKRIEVEADPSTVVHVELRLIRADNPDQALAEATRLGTSEEVEYANPAGRRVSIRFLGLRDLNVIHDPLEHGAELLYEEHRGLAPDVTAALVREREALSVFRPIEPSAGPDNTSAEVLAEARVRLESRGGAHEEAARPEADREGLARRARRWLSLWDGGARATFDELHHPDFVDRSPSGRGTDGDAFRRGIAELRTAFPDFHGEVVDLVVDLPARKVAVRWTGQGTHGAAFLGRPATGRTVGFTGVEIVRFDGDRIIERWGEWDVVDLPARFGPAS